MSGRRKGWSPEMAYIVVREHELPSEDKRAQNLREITDHLLHGSGKRGE